MLQMDFDLTSIGDEAVFKMEVRASRIGRACGQASEEMGFWLHSFRQGHATRGGGRTQRACVTVMCAREEGWLVRVLESGVFLFKAGAYPA